MRCESNVRSSIAIFCCAFSVQSLTTRWKADLIDYGPISHGHGVTDHQSSVNQCQGWVIHPAQSKPLWGTNHARRRFLIIHSRVHFPRILDTVMLPNVITKHQKRRRGYFYIRGTYQSLFFGSPSEAVDSSRLVYLASRPVFDVIP
jgi:hypothetical protein